MLQQLRLELSPQIHFINTILNESSWRAHFSRYVEKCFLSSFFYHFSCWNPYIRLLCVAGREATTIRSSSLPLMSCSHIYCILWSILAYFHIFLSLSLSPVACVCVSVWRPKSWKIASLINRHISLLLYFLFCLIFDWIAVKFIWRSYIFCWTIDFRQWKESIHTLNIAIHRASTVWIGQWISRFISYCDCLLRALRLVDLSNVTHFRLQFDDGNIQFKYWK